MSERITSHVELLLSELLEASRALRDLTPAYVRALKRWGEAEKRMAEDHIMLAEAIVDKQTSIRGRLSDQLLRQINTRFENRPDEQGALRELRTVVEQWNAAMARVIQAESQYLTYASMLEAEEEIPDVLDAIKPWWAHEVPRRGSVRLGYKKNEE